MENEKRVPIKKRTYWFLVTVALLTLIIWAIGLHVNVYQYKLLGAFFEMIWLPNIIFSVAVLLGTGYSWMRENFSFRSKFLHLIIGYCLLLWAAFYL